jgi:hypothetical protein
VTTYRPSPGALRAPESEIDAPSPLAARLGAVVWPSFFAAGVATMTFFGVVDPQDLAAISWPQLSITRELGYTIGFFMFWLCTLSACWVTSLLLDLPAHVRLRAAHERTQRGTRERS